MSTGRDEERNGKPRSTVEIACASSSGPDMNSPEVVDVVWRSLSVTAVAPTTTILSA